MTPEQLSAIAKTLAVTPAARPLGGVQYVPLPQYLDVLKAAQALYAQATAPVPKAKP